MNNNKSDENAILAHCKGVFAKTGYITFGTDGAPLPYGASKELNRSCYGGKQFAVAAPKTGKTTDVYFEKKHNWISEGDQYMDRWRYAEQQKEKKKGFLTSDFSKRDEFSNTTRTNQWREQLTQEDKFSKRILEMMSNADSFVATKRPTKEADKPRVPLYDLVFETPDPTFTGSSKCNRDTKNRTRMSNERSLGTLTTMSRLAFPPAQEFSKPEHARKPIIRDTFYRKTNVFFPQGCASTTPA